MLQGVGVSGRYILNQDYFYILRKKHADILNFLFIRGLEYDSFAPSDDLKNPEENIFL
jgi:hypothetical protein